MLNLLFKFVLSLLHLGGGPVEASGPESTSTAEKSDPTKYYKTTTAKTKTDSIPAKSKSPLIVFKLINPIVKKKVEIKKVEKIVKTSASI